MSALGITIRFAITTVIFFLVGMFVTRDMDEYTKKTQNILNGIMQLLVVLFVCSFIAIIWIVK
jgi:hypothetical protein